MKSESQVFRAPWDGFPDLVIHADEFRVKHHPSYRAGKSGNVAAALELTRAMVSETCLALLAKDFGAHHPILVAAHAVESEGVNAIPQAMAGYLGCLLAWPVEPAIVQTNVVGHTGADTVFSFSARRHY